MKVIFDEFLPLSWTWSGGEDEESPGSKKEVAHGRPQVAALKLVMVVCSAGRNLTSQLVRMMVVQICIGIFITQCLEDKVCYEVISTSALNLNTVLKIWHENIYKIKSILLAQLVPIYSMYTEHVTTLAENCNSYE